MAKDFNETVHLPQTKFPMRASLPQREPAMLESFEEKQIYNTLMEKNKDKPKFILHDGPPYANGDIHIGHSLNKIIKDIIVRYKNMTGFYAPYVPGWDTHGLPVESAIMKNKKIKFSELSVTEFRNHCRDYALSYVDRQKEQFKRLGVIGDWDNPYITLTSDFEAEQIRVFGKMAEKGYIYKGLKPVYWCYTDETALAEAEIEYQDDPCTTLYVKFPVKDDLGKLAQFGDVNQMSFVIWTTTAWTLPGNRAISLNPEIDYVLLKAENGEVYIVAEELRETICETAGLTNTEVLTTQKGAFFELMVANHPFEDINSYVLCGEHVTTEAGTGCVHTAPGFGADDFDICKRYNREGKLNIESAVPVNSRGVMIDNTFQGVHLSKANDVVIPALEEKGLLLAKTDIVHSYPHCWRCKKPVVFRATEQWFCSVNSIKDTAIQACDDIWWKPEWGKERMVSMIAERSDWCISRQRKWGVPIPIFFCDSCGEHIVTPDSIEHIANLFAEHSSNIWFEKDAMELIPENFTCPHCGSKEHFTKETDIMDVWFDSGSTHAGVLAKRPELAYPADLYLEGGDQYRGWFQSSMLTSISANGIAPYKQIVTHGWTVDGEGKAMHKSAGNAVAPAEIIKDYGADVLRLWVSSGDFTQDVRISKEIMKQLSQAYLKIRNTARFMLGNLNDFDANSLVAYEDMTDIDRYVLHTFNAFVGDVHRHFAQYNFHAVYRDIYQYCVVELSNFYFDITKDRLYCDAEEKRASAQTAIYHILDGLTRILAPILAFTSEEIWGEMPHDESVDSSSVLYNDMPQYREDLVLQAEELDRWNKVKSLRDAVNKALENVRNQGGVKKNQDALITIYLKEEKEASMLQEMDLASIFIVSKVNLIHGEGNGEQAQDCAIAATILVEEAQAPKCPRCWNRNEDANEDGLCPRCATVLAE